MDNLEYPSVEVQVGDGLGIEGTIISHKKRMTQWGMSYSMLIEVDAGEGRYRLYGPVPRALGIVEPGMQVTMIANVKQSDDDKTFGFFSRPRQAHLIGKD